MSADVIIRKQKIRIKTDNEDLAFDCRRSVNERLNDELVKMYERIFHQESRSDDYVIIDSLRIDLGVLSTTDFNDHVIQLIEEKLISELKKQFEDSPPKDFRTKYNSDSTAPIEFVTERQQKREALLCFFENGVYPWWFKKGERKKPSQLLRELDADDKESLFLKIITLAKSLHSDAAAKFVKRLTDNLEPWAYENYIRQIANLYSDNSIQINLNLLLANKRQFIELFNISSEAFYEQLLRFILLHDSKHDFLKAFASHLMRVFRGSIDDLKSRAAIFNADEFFVDTLTSIWTIPENDNAPDQATGSKAVNKLREVSSSRPDEGFYIENAGLILLHPFLGSYFKELELLNEEDQFMSQEAQMRATVLLYYMQSSNEDYSEWEMPFNKVLCGMNTNDVIPNNIMLTAVEKEESKQLLQTVVDYWDALKGSSIEAMQNSFILREGKLAYRDNYWLIQVERSGLDILLDRLPWGIGTIKLPWLKELIYTEW